MIDPKQASTVERSAELILPDPTPASYLTVDELEESLKRKGTVDPGPGLYPRDGVVPVEVIEGQVAEVTLGDQANNVIMASGMSAVREAVIFAADLKGPDPTVAYADELYKQSSVHFSKLGNMGVDVVSFDGGRRGLEIALLENKADVIFAETVANGPGLSVVDIYYLLELIRGMDNPPIVILDNTMPLSTGVDFSKLLEPSDRVMIVESGTKNLMNNSELLGLVYSSNLKLVELFRKHKAHSGALNSVGASRAISEKLAATIPGFHDRNRQVFSSTGKIALALAEARDELGSDTDFITGYPTLDSHPDHDHAESLTPDGLAFASPVVFLERRGQDARPLIRRLAEHPALRPHLQEGEIRLGQSFGMPKARLLYEVDAPVVRLSGGFDLADEDALAAAVKEAAADK